MLEQVGFIETLYNTRRSDQDEVTLRHAPCPGQGRSGDMFLCVLQNCCRARYQRWVLHVQPNHVSWFSMCMLHV